MSKVILGEIAQHCKYSYDQLTIWIYILHHIINVFACFIYGHFSFLFFFFFSFSFQRDINRSYMWLSFRIVD